MNRLLVLAVSLALLVGCSCGKTTPQLGVSEQELSLPCNTTLPTDGRFAPGIIPIPHDGYTDSVFVNAQGDRIYFTHSYLAPLDFKKGTTNYPPGQQLPGQTVGANLDWNSDLYYVQWDGIAWQGPYNLGSAVDGTNVNSLGNECCLALNDTETEMVFYRDTFGLASLGPTGNFVATRPDRDSPWSQPVLLPGSYGADGQTSTVYLHDLQKTTSGDFYGWQHSGTNYLIYGRRDGMGGWLAPTLVPGLENLSPQIQSQPWVSHDEKTLLFNERDASGNTNLKRSNRSSLFNPWGSPKLVTLIGFTDPAGAQIWGEPSFSADESYMLFTGFDTSVSGWKALIRFVPGCSNRTSFSNPITLNQ